MVNDIDINKPSKLLPSPLIMYYWETMVLNNEKYTEFTKLLGINVNFKSQDKLYWENIDLKKQEEIKLKYIKTIEFYKKYFPNINNIQDNTNIWTASIIKNNHESQQPSQTHTTVNSTTTKPILNQTSTTTTTTSTTSTADSKKPTLNQKEPPIIISLSDQNGGEDVNFKIKKTTKLETVFKVFCEATKVSIHNCKFYFNGNNIIGDRTPNCLGIIDGDKIDVDILQQVGC